MFQLSLRCLKVHSTTTSATGEWEERSMTDTVALRILYCDRQMRTHAKSSITVCSTGQSVNHLHHRGGEDIVHCSIL